MQVQLLKVISMPLLFIQLLVVYLWLVKWELLVTKFGLIGWIISIVWGFILLVFLKNKSIIFGRIILVTTSLVLFLAVVSVLIEIVTSSMP